jgi:hypothetical protein
MTRLWPFVPLLVAAALAAVAVVTVQRAGCDDPGHYELAAGGYELVGGCIAPGDIVMPNPAPPAKPLVTNPSAPSKG